MAHQLVAGGLSAVLLSYPRDVLYYTGTAQPANLLVLQDGEAVLFARRALAMVKEEVEGIDVVLDASFEGIRERLGVITAPPLRLGVALDVMPSRHFRRLQTLLPGWEMADASGIVLKQRSVKQPCEITAVQDAVALSAVAHQTICRVLAPGVTPVGLAAEVGRSLRLAGAEEVLFFRRWDAWLPASGIFASGPEAAVISGHAMTVTGVGSSQALPWGPSMRPIRKGEILYADLGLNLAGYHGDFTRSYVVGRADGRARELFAAALEAQDAAISALVPGRPARNSLLAAQRAVAAKGLTEFFQGYGSQRGDYVGHGLGLELDEPPTLSSSEEWPLESNMCLAIETKIMIPQWGAVGIEDTVVVEGPGPRVLTPLPRELIEVDA